MAEKLPHVHSDWLTAVRQGEDDDDGVDKNRVYIDSPGDAPDDVEVQEGPEGGLYYETEEAETASDNDDDDAGVDEGDDDEEEEAEIDRITSGEADLSEPQREFIERQPEVVSTIHNVNQKVGPKITQSFMRNASKVLDHLDPEVVDTAATLFLSEDEEFPDVSFGLSKAKAGRHYAKLVLDAQTEFYKESEEVLEIKDYYRVWVKSPDDVPEEQRALYDRDGDPAGNHYYYEVPLETSTRIELDDGDLYDKMAEEMHKSDGVDYPTRDDLVAAGVPEKDLTLIDKASTQLEQDFPLFGSDLRKANPDIFENVASPLSLLHLYKKLYDEGDRYSAYLNQIQKELGRRGVYGVEKISKARRYIDTPDSVPEGRASASPEERKDGELNSSTTTEGDSKYE